LLTSIAARREKRKNVSNHGGNLSKGQCDFFSLWSVPAMKAIIFRKFGDPGVLEYDDLPDPVPDANQVLIRVHTTTVNRLDVFQRAGSRPVTLPFVAGLEAAGVIAADGHGFRAGERVVTTRPGTFGGYASLIATNADGVVRIPDDVNDEEAAALGLAASTAWAALFDKGQMQEGERVLITAGASGVGTAAIQLVKLRNGWAAATAGGAEKAAKLRALGTDLVIDHKETKINDAIRTVQPDGVNLVMENVGSTLPDALAACAPDARIVLVGNAGGRDVTLDTQDWRLRRITIMGGGVLRTSPANERVMLDAVAAGKLRPAIARVLNIRDAAEAHRLIEDNAVFGKIILRHEA
jgi:NADPH:quinone reductase-like Zn-dependent oxidoreductase